MAPLVLPKITKSVKKARPLLDSVRKQKEEEEGGGRAVCFRRRSFFLPHHWNSLRVFSAYFAGKKKGEPAERKRGNRGACAGRCEVKEPSRCR